MLNLRVSSNYAAVEDGTGTAAVAEPPKRSWGRILAATLACVALLLLYLYRRVRKEMQPELV